MSDGGTRERGDKKPGPFAALEWLESRSDGGKAVAGGILTGAALLAFALGTALGWPAYAVGAAALASIGLVILAFLGVLFAWSLRAGRKQSR